MLNIPPEMAQPLVLALDHHKRLLEEAQRRRLGAVAYEPPVPAPRRWRRLRFRVGDLLINIGQRLKTDAVLS